MANTFNHNGKVVITDAGNVGIGTTAPTATLDARIAGTTSGAVIKVGNVGSGDFGGLAVSDGGTYPVQLYGSSLAFLTGNSAYASATEKVRITSGGNVLINTTTDLGYKLFVNGSIVNQGNINSTGDPGLLIDTGQRLGFNESGVRSWTVKATGGNLAFNSGDGYGSFTFGASVTASSLIKSGGTSSQYLMADGSVSTIQTANVYTQTFFIADTSGTAQWVKVGTWTAAQGGQVVTVEIAGHAGYNATTGQNQSVYIYMKTSNGNSVDPSGFAADSSFYTQGLNVAIGAGNVIWEANAAGVSATTYTLYVLFGQYTNGSQYTVTSRGGTWANVGTLTAPSGTTSSSTILLSEFRYSANNQLLTLDGNSSVLIGTTTNAGFKLDVDGTGRFTNLLQVNGPSGEARTDLHGISLYNANNDYRISLDTQSGTRGFIRYNVDTAGSTFHGHIFSAGDYNSSVTDLMLVRADGNVGIGTDSPGAKLHNYSTANSNVFISGYGTAAQNDWGGEHAFFVNANNGIIIGKANAQNDTNRLYTFYNDAAGNAEQYIYNTSNTATIKLDSAGDTYFNGGNVGIGTTVPAQKLEVVGVTRLTDTNANPLELNRGLDVDSVGPAGVGMSFGTLKTGVYKPGAHIFGVLESNGTDGTFGIQTRVGDVLTTKLTINSVGEATFSSSVTARQGIINGLGGSRYQMLTLTAGGTSDEGLFITTTGTGNDYYAIKVATGGSANTFAVTNAGNVGIGTTSPSAPLQVVAASPSNQGVLNISNTYASGGVYFPATKFKNNRGDHSFGIVSEFSTGSTNGSDRPSILFYSDIQASASWQVGQVTSGWGGNDSFGIGYRANGVPSTFNTWPTTYFMLTTGGNVLIGTTTDSGYKLRVNGTAKFDGVISADPGITSGYGTILTGYNSSFQITVNADYSGGQTNTYTPQYAGVAGAGMFVMKQRNGGEGNVDIWVKQSGTDGSTQNFSTFTNILNLNTNGTVGIGVVDATLGLQVADGRGFLVGPSGASGSTYVSPSDENTINGGYGIATDTADIWLNYRGYQDGFSYFRDTRIGNGKGSAIVMVDGSAGNVGIGTTAPAAKLEVIGSIRNKNASANDNYSQLSTTESTLTISTYSVNTGSYPAPIIFSPNLSERMRITDAGNVLIGTTTDSGYKLRVNGEILADDDIRIFNTFALVLNGSDANWRIGRNTITDSGWLTGNTLQVVVFGSSSGQGFQVVNSNGTALFEIDGVAGASRFTNALGVGVNPSGTAGRIDASNDIVAYSSSDLRLKENIKPIENALDKVKALTGVEFDWKAEHKEAHGYEGHDTGIIAQEVQEVMPTAVRVNDTGYLAVRYEKLIGLLVEANKELAARVEELEKKLK